MKRATGMIAVLVAACVASACGGKSGSSSAPVSSNEGGAGSSAAGSVALSGGGSYAARDPRPGGNFLNDATFPLNELVSGGVSRGGIPSLNQPRFIGPRDPETFYINPNESVLGVVINGEAKAYPHNIGWYHEIINDEVGGRKIAVTLCPLTSTRL